MTQNPTRPPAILVADDSAAVRHYLGELLTTDGCQVLEASDGNRCLEMIANAAPDVVLLDLEMPGKSGFEVLQEIGNLPRIFSIILCTASSSPEQVAEGFALGADDYIAKPFSEADLLARTRVAVRTARQKQALAKAHRETEEALDWLKLTQARLVDEEKVGAVARLAAGAAHHINNPLGFVMSNLSTLGRYTKALEGFTEQLAQELVLLVGEERVRELEKAHRVPQIRKDLPSLLQETKEGGLRIAFIVQQLSQLELGYFGQESAELDLADLLRPLVSMASDLAPPDSQVLFEHPPEPVLVWGSVSLLNAALLAILKNACEALDSLAGTVTVELITVLDRARILITDSGPGITEGSVDALFDPFFSTKSPESHAGLGLTIARGFIACQGGSIAVSATPRGTCVAVELPLKKEGA